MKITDRLILALALALACTAIGCGADPAAMPGGGGSNSGDDDGDDPGMEAPKPLDATGKYAVHSTFDLATNMPGTAGQVVNTIIAATDGANDPTQWILEQLLAKLPDAVKPYAGLIAAVAAPAINKELDKLLPGIRTTIELVGSDFGSIAKQFGLNETLELTRSSTGYTAVHTVTGVHFKLDNQDVDLALSNYHVSNVVVNNIAVTMDATGQLAFAAHDIPLEYGQILRIGLDAAIIPLIDSSAQNLNQLLAHEIDCQRIGKAIAARIGDVVSADTLAAACRSGLDAAADLVYFGIDAVDGTALNFGVSGSARGADKNKDRNIDTIQSGTWSGTLSYGSTPSSLVPAAFFGERM